MTRGSEHSLVVRAATNTRDLDALTGRKSWRSTGPLVGLGGGVWTQQYECSNCLTVRLTDGRTPNPCSCEVQA